MANWTTFIVFLIALKTDKIGNIYFDTFILK